ncbi:hypothetical protein C455_07065 [Haloferax larsenii JCM 13917]|nr:hypothetical protein [Haloferax larsenii]ELZ80106.1 hypothetical protein C455_07065 [Haloferax larsenii JCM 13917]
MPPKETQMNCSQTIYEALDRVADEESHVTNKSAAVDEFCVRVRGLSPQSGQTVGAAHASEAGGSEHATAAATGTMVHQAAQSGTGPDLCQQVCRTFAETIRPHSVADVDSEESLLTTIQAELGEEIAVALSPSSGTTDSPALQAAVLTAATTRLDELQTMEKALRAERESLRTALDDIEAVVEFEDPTRDPPLLYWSFEELQSAHDRLTVARERCDRISRERQRTIHGTAACRSNARVSHSSLVEYLYSDGAANYPVLSTIARLDQQYAERQRAVRDHLTRRV